METIYAATHVQRMDYLVLTDALIKITTTNAALSKSRNLNHQMCSAITTKFCTYVVHMCICDCKEEKKI